MCGLCMVGTVSVDLNQNDLELCEHARQLEATLCCPAISSGDTVEAGFRYPRLVTPVASSL